MDLPTRQDFFNIGRAYVLARAQKIDPNQVDVQGSEINLFVGATSVIAHALIAQLGYQISRLFFEGAKEDESDQDRLAWDRYLLARKGASPATVSLVFSRTATDGGSGSIPIGTIVSTSGTSTEIQYTTQQAATFTNSTLIASPVIAQAVQAGKESEVGAGTLTKIKSPIFDTSIRVINQESSAGGESREDVDTFDSRLRDFWNAARRGTLSAIEYGATEVAGVTSAQAIETLDSLGNPTGAVKLYFADSSGVANATQIPAIRSSLKEWRCAGIPVQIVVGTPLIVSVTLKLRFDATVDATVLSDIVKRAIVEFVNSLPINASLSRGDLFALLRRYKSNGLIVLDDAIVYPPGDLVPPAGKTIRTMIEQVILF